MYKLTGIKNDIKNLGNLIIKYPKVIGKIAVMIGFYEHLGGRDNICEQILSKNDRIPYDMIALYKNVIETGKNNAKFYFRAIETAYKLSDIGHTPIKIACKTCTEEKELLLHNHISVKPAANNKILVKFNSRLMQQKSAIEQCFKIDSYRMLIGLYDALLGLLGFGHDETLLIQSLSLDLVKTNSKFTMNRIVSIDDNEIGLCEFECSSAEDLVKKAIFYKYAPADIANGTKLKIHRTLNGLDIQAGKDYFRIKVVDTNDLLDWPRLYSYRAKPEEITELYEKEKHKYENYRVEFI